MVSLKSLTLNVTAEKSWQILPNFIVENFDEKELIARIYRQQNWIQNLLKHLK